VRDCEHYEDITRLDTHRFLCRDCGCEFISNTEIDKLQAEVQELRSALKERKAQVDACHKLEERQKTEIEILKEALDYMIEKMNAIHTEAEFLTPGNVTHRKASLRSICLNVVNRVNNKCLKKL
jgi:hypothetical protein